MGRDDLHNGQRSALPGLDPDDAQGSEDEETVLALQYLRSVRDEASGIPHVMTTKAIAQITPHNHEAEDGTWRGYYSDGAYIAAPILGPTSPDTTSALPYEDISVREDTAIDVASLYHAQLLRRYDAWKAKLHNSTPSTTHTLSTPQWRHALLRGWPSTQTIQSLPQSTILGALHTVSKTVLRPSLLRASPREQRRVGAWAWALLGVLRESGTLDGEAIATVRALGKEAVVLSEYCTGARRGIGDGGGAGRLNAAELESREVVGALDGLLDVDGGEDDEVTSDPIDLEDAQHESENGVQQRRNSSSVGSDVDAHVEMGEVQEGTQRRRRNSSSSLSSIENNEASADEMDGVRTREDKQCLVAALDMIITVVGERYGQRDLLSARRVLWAQE